MNYIIWNGQDSRNIRGLVICELPPISKPQMRIAETVVDGVDGSHIEELGYSTYDKAMLIGITSQADVNEVIKFFSGKGDVVFSNEPDKYYKAHIVNQVDYTRLVRFRTATVTFRVQPFKYEYQEVATKLGTNEINIFDCTSTSCTIERNGDELAITPISTGNPVVVVKCNLTAGTYYLHLNKIFSEINVAFFDVDENKVGLNISKSGSFVLPSNVASMRVNTLASSGSYTLRADDIYINEGKTDLGYEPYGITATELVVTNIGNYKSKPVITINGTGTIEFSLNDNSLFRYTFPETETSVVVDSQKQDAYFGAFLKNRNMSGEFPVFEVGANTIKWTGAITNIKVLSKSRWI
jgi:phage-related protein